MKKLTDFDNLIALMQEKAVVITPNKRLAKSFLEDFFKSNQANVQDKPFCLPLNSFLEIQYKKLAFNNLAKTYPHLLTKAQLNFLWENTLEEQNLDKNLAKAMQEAWDNSLAWGLSFKDPLLSSTNQAKLFLKIVSKLEAKLIELDAISQSQLIDFLIKEDFEIKSNSLIFACFNDFSPQLEIFQRKLAKQGTEIFHYEPKEKEADIKLFAAKDEKEEYQSLISWLKANLGSSAQIAVVVPNLAEKSQQLIRLLEKEIPNLEFNISLGEALSHFPLVAHALHLLSLNQSKLKNKDLKLLLHSPFVQDSAKEMLARASFAEEHFLLLEEEIPFSKFIDELEKRNLSLASLLQNLNLYPSKASVESWIDSFKERLFSLGFPGEYSLNSANYQCYQRFLNLLDEFKLYQFIKPEMTLDEALTHFKTLCQNTLFQAETKKARIHILGLLEASGLSFDKLWFLGFTDQILPQGIKPSPFIPLGLQKSKEMPHASLDREKRLADKIIHRFKQAADEIVFSYPAMTEEKPNLPSPLIKELPAYCFSAEPPIAALKKPLEVLAEDYQLPLKPEEKVFGGTAILANQAKCPFRAFASHRLHLKERDNLSEGPNARERGHLIHELMETLWLQLEDQQKLLALSEDELDQIIDKAIEKALEPIIQRRAFSFSKLIQEVEIKRLKRLVKYCLNWEKERPPFKVEKLEGSFAITLGELPFNIRVDRLDSLSDGSKWVIDYKSSLPSPLPWREERPQEPQLLLYALLDNMIKGLLFTQIKTGQFEAKGITENDYKIKGLTALKKDESWAELQLQWHEQLSALSNEFSQGLCAPKPLKASICQNCDFQGLCRFSLS